MGTCDMGSENHIGQFQKRTVGSGGLLDTHVEHRGEIGACKQYIRKFGFTDDVASRGVDEGGARLRAREMFPCDHPFGFGATANMERNNTTRSEERRA